MVVLILAVGCAGGKGGGDPATEFPLEQGVSAMLRLVDGSPATDARSLVGSISRTDPDSAGMTYYLDVPPGRTPIVADLIPYMQAYGAVEVKPDVLSAVRLELATLTVVDIPDSWATTIEGPGFTLDIPADAATVDEAPWTGPWHLGWLVVGEGERAAQPADLWSVRNDVDLEPIVAHQVLGFRAWNDDGDPVQVLEPVLRLEFDIPAGSPLLRAEAPQMYRYSHARSYWGPTGSLEVDPGALTATLDGFGALGWMAAGTTAPERGCVTGTLVDDAGAGISGATVTLLQDGTVGVDRATSLGGEFCLAMDPGAGATLQAYGMASDRGAIYTLSERVGGPTGPGPCGSPTCLDLGILEVEVHEDADRDRYFAGPGGDCDDADPDVNPNLAFGDGRFCGEEG